MYDGNKGREEKTQTLKQNLRFLFFLFSNAARVSHSEREAPQHARTRSLTHTLTHSHTQTEPAERGKNEEELARTFQLS